MQEHLGIQGNLIRPYTNHLSSEEGQLIRGWVQREMHNRTNKDQKRQLKRGGGGEGPRYFCNNFNGVEECKEGAWNRKRKTY